MKSSPLPWLAVLLTLAITISVTTAWAGAAPAPAHLRCEYLANPLGLAETSPRLGWTLPSSARNVTQTAYQVLVASSLENLKNDKGDRWDSGRVESSESAHVIYAGQPLTSRAACFWKVRVWTGGEPPSAWSEPARWTQGLLRPEDWWAKWIDPLGGAAERPVTVIRAVYESVKNPKRAKDVTEQVRAHVKDGTLDLRVNNETLGGDPAENEMKQLSLDYEQDGQPLHLEFVENQRLRISRFVSSVKYMRKTFVAPKPVREARLYITALGLYDARLNGRPVGDHVLAPDFTDYHKRVRYQCYDVTSLVARGANALAAQIANGWYSGHIGNGGYQPYGTTPALLAQLEITYADGSRQTIVSDRSWKTHAGPITATDFMFGETHDARAEIPGWDRPNFNDAAWKAVSERTEKPIAIDSQVAPPVRELMVLDAKSVSQPRPGRWVFDLGQNMVGVPRIKVRAPAGTKITIRHAEILNPDGTLYTPNLRGAPSVDTYISRGGLQTWQPRFTFHGFRYVELSGLPEKPGRDAVAGVVWGSDTPFTGSFTCSNQDVNQLAANIQWGQRGNFLSIPTDCPQRDERLGWMGDAQVFIRTATTNADVASFFTKWLVDVDDAQTPEGAFTDIAPAPPGTAGNRGGTPAWGDAGVICPWTIYEAYGDRRILERHLPAMKRWIEWCRAHSTDLIRDRDLNGNYGDWLSIQADTPKDVIGTAYFAYSTHLVAKACAVLGQAKEAAKYRQLFADIVAAFNRRFVEPDGRIHGDTQCVYAMALKFELLPESLRAKAVEYLADDIEKKGHHLSTGFVGVSYLLPMLTQGGRLDVAYTLLMQDSFPSWLFSVKHGATTIWERWDGWTPDRGFQEVTMNSFNHYSLGSCGEWLFATVAGIGWDPAAPGYKRIVIHPQPGGGLTSAQATLGSVYGPIRSAWKKEGGAFRLDVTIPANTTATVILPAKSAAAITESGKSLGESPEIRVTDDEKTPPGKVALTVGSGDYRFVAKP